MFSNMVTRALSGALFVLIVVGSILLSEYSFALVFSLISAWSVVEFHRITNRENEIEVKWIWSALGAFLLFASSYMHARHTLNEPVYSFYGFYILILLISELYRKKQNPLNNWVYFLFGQIYIALPFALLNYILFIESFNPILLLSVFLTIWVNDTFAYIFGVTLGKHRLFERISPKKSWEGFFGGALASLGAGYAFSLFIPDLNLTQWLIFSQLVVLFGTFGDLVESLLKRTIHVKDSGNVIPGHGGLLDRFDSMLLVAPAIYIFLSFIF